MKPAWTGLLAVVLVGVLGLTVVVAQQGGPDEVQLRAAVKKETVDGDVKGAIAIYEQLRKSASRAVAAKALVRLGQCHEKLGDAEARRAYEEVIGKYADQAEAVADARARLAALGDQRQANVATGPIVRTIGMKTNGPIGNGNVGTRFWGSPSPDGRVMVGFRDSDAGSELFILNVATGESKVVATLTPDLWWSAAPLFSPDARQIAYEVEGGENKEVRLVGVDGGGARTIARLPDEVFMCDLHGWSSDGREILIDWSTMTKSPRGAMPAMTTTVARISVADGSIARLAAWEGDQFVVGAALSPDGRYVVLARSDRQTMHGLSIIPFRNAGQPSSLKPLIPAGKGDRYPAWTPDGGGIVFWSDRTGGPGLWFIRVADGQAVGQPVLLKADMGPAEHIGLSRSGVLFYSVRTGHPGIFTATIDPKTGRLAGEPIEMDSSMVSKMAPARPEWSPDGQQFAYNSARQVPGSLDAPTLTIYSIVTGRDRTFEVPGGGGPQRATSPSWAVDGKSVFVLGSLPADVVTGPGESRLATYRVDAQTGATVRLTEKKTSLQGATLSPDGRGFYVLSFRGTGAAATSVIAFRDLATGEESDRVVVLSPGRIQRLAVSKDGTNLVLLVRDRSAGTWALQVASGQGGDRRTLVTLKEPGQLDAGSLTWTGDGKAVLAIRSTEAGDDARRELWRFPVDGDAPQGTGLAMDNLAATRAQPNGNKVLFTTGRFTYEIRALEHFLPTVKK